MPISVTEEHEELRRTVRRWLDANWPPEAARAGLESPPEDLPVAYKELAAQGWLGLHVEERHGGQGFGMTELAVVLEELGWSCVPGPVLPSLLVAGLLSAYADEEQRSELLPSLVDGSITAAVCFGPGALTGQPVGEGPSPDQGTTGLPLGDLKVSGVVRPVLGAPTASVALVAVSRASLGGAVQGPTEWCLVDIGAGSRDVEVRSLPAFDPSRPLGEIECRDVVVPASRRLARVTGDHVRQLAAVLGAAEAAGGARWCLETTAEYAKVRVQFGRPIGQFQAVKHRLADMLVRVEQAAAVGWDAAVAWDAAVGGLGGGPAADDGLLGERALATGVAAAVCLDAYTQCAKDCVQLHGGIGFTWEHDAHRYLRRAMATAALLDSSDGGSPEARVASLALSGVRRTLRAELPPEADALRGEIGELLDQAASLSGPAQRTFLVEQGLLAPHWPRPWGRDASPLEQLVVQEEAVRSGVTIPSLGIGAWALPTLIAHGTPEQQERLVGPTLGGELSWCQLFSEPGAGSDLASLSTRGERVDGGWRLNGQKVWTSLARTADFGICLVRTDPDVPKHDGITYMVVDMRASGIDIRPLREMTGEAMFNEVFLDDVFVPDEDVVGRPGQGWRIARTTLANERVSMSSGSTFGMGVESLLRILSRSGEGEVPGATETVGRLLAEAQSIQLIGHRSTLRTLAGTDPGPGASVRKLLGVEHEQRVQETGFSLLGAEAAVMEGRAARWGTGFLSTRCLTIAGGTSEVQRNVIAERLLGMPKDPEPGA